MESLWKPVIKRLDQRLCDFKLPRNLSGKNFFSFFVVLCWFVCVFVFLFVAAFFFFWGGGVGGWFIKISYLCYLSWLARAFSNSRKYIAKYSYSSSNAIYFFSSE